MHPRWRWFATWTRYLVLRESLVALPSGLGHRIDLRDLGELPGTGALLGPGGPESWEV